MKTADEIKKGLETCSADECHGQHTDCPYHPDLMCIRNICADALALIQQLEVDNSQLRNYIRLLQAERDAAVACIPRVCKYCKHDGPLNAWGESECELDSVFPNGCLNGNTGWQWRGVQKEE